MIQVYKETFSERQVYRYRVTDEDDRLLYLVEPTGFFLPNPTRQVTLLDADGLPVGRIEPPEQFRWPGGGDYTVVLEEQETPLVVITEQWELVDLLLLRLPRYFFQWDGNPYIARGNRFGERFYEIFSYSPEPVEAASEDIGVDALPADLDPAKLQEVAEKEVRHWGEPIGAIWRPPRGAHYLAEFWAPPLQNVPLLLTVLIVLADLHLQEREGGDA